MSGYRSDLEAARQRADALERRVRELEAERDAPASAPAARADVPVVPATASGLAAASATNPEPASAPVEPPSWPRRYPVRAAWLVVLAVAVTHLVVAAATFPHDAEGLLAVPFTMLSLAASAPMLVRGVATRLSPSVTFTERGEHGMEQASYSPRFALGLVFVGLLIEVATVAVVAWRLHAGA